MTDSTSISCLLVIHEYTMQLTAVTLELALIIKINNWSFCNKYKGLRTQLNDIFFLYLLVSQMKMKLHLVQ